MEVNTKNATPILSLNVSSCAFILGIVELIGSYDDSKIR